MNLGTWKWWVSKRKVVLQPSILRCELLVSWRVYLYLQRTTKIAVSEPSWSTPNSKFFVFFFARLKQDSNGLGPLCFQKELTEKLFSQRGATRFSSMKKPFPFPFLLKLFKFNNDSPRAARLSGILPHKPKLISKSLGTEPKRRVWDVWSYWIVGGGIYVLHLSHEKTWLLRVYRGLYYPVIWGL